MNGSTRHSRPLLVFVAGFGLWATVGLCGCTVQQGGQTLPSAYYMEDDVQYFPAGPEFKLAKEAAAQKAAREEAALQQPQQPQPPR